MKDLTKEQIEAVASWIAEHTYPARADMFIKHFTPKPKYDVGQVVRVVDDTSNHCVKIGDKVRIKRINTSPIGCNVVDIYENFRYIRYSDIEAI